MSLSTRFHVTDHGVVPISSRWWLCSSGPTRCNSLRRAASQGEGEDGEVVFPLVLNREIECVLHQELHGWSALAAGFVHIAQELFERPGFSAFDFGVNF